MAEDVYSFGDWVRLRRQALVLSGAGGAIIGAAEVLRITIRVRRVPAARPAYERDVATARAQLDDATFDAAWAAGHALTLEQAIAEALNR